jgi:transposase
MPRYAAFNVSKEETAVHVVDETGRTVWHGKRASDPEALATSAQVTPVIAGGEEDRFVSK